MSVPWVAQTPAGNSWDKTMCCGPAVITMVKGYVDKQTNLGDPQLKSTIDWMHDNVAGFTKSNYDCVGTDSDQVVKTLKEYVGVQAEAMTIDWCDLHKKLLDGTNIVIFHGDSQGSNVSATFKSGSSHWLILERIDGDYAYVDDPGRSTSQHGDSRKYTVESVKQRFEARGKLAIISPIGTTTPPPCPNAPNGDIVSPTSGQTVCKAFEVKGSAQDKDGIDKLGVTLGEDPNCKFTKTVSGAPWTDQYTIPVNIDGACKPSEGLHDLALWVEDKCGTSKKVSTSKVYVKCETTCPPCGVCKSCSASAGVCVPDASSNGTQCDTGKICSDGDCVTKTADPCSSGAQVYGVKPLKATLGQLTKFTVTGKCLPTTIAPWIADCEGIKVTKASSTVAEFTCTPKWSAGKKAGVIKNAPGGNLLLNFTINVEDCTNASVDAVTPTTAKLNTPTVFTIAGACLPSTTIAWLEDCDGLKMTSVESTQAKFSCTPKWTKGVKEGTVKDKAGGAALKSFSVDVN